LRFYPDIQGRKSSVLHNQILKGYDPGVTAIVSGGYSNDTVMSKYKENGFAGVSGKPFSFEDLRKEIERVLAEDA